MKNSFQWLTKIVIAIFLFQPAIVLKVDSLDIGFTAKAAESTKKKTRRTPAMREKIYSQLARAQKLADEKNVAEGLEILESLNKRADQLNSYEQAMVWNALGFIYYSNDKINQAVAAFEQVVKQENIPESLELSTLFSLAQLSMQAEKYEQSLTYLSKWEALKEGEAIDKGLVLKANAYYALKDYAAAEKAISSAISKVEAEGKVAKENWLVLKRALHYELKQPRQVTQVSEKLVRHYSKPKYWIELSNMYGEVGEATKQLAVLEAAYQQGFVTNKSDIRSLAQQYFFSGAPYKAAKLMSEQLAKGNIEGDIKTLQFLAQAWSAAKEGDKAIPVLLDAAKQSSDGNIDAQLAEVLVNQSKYEQAIEVANRAKEKGELKNPGHVDVALGMAHYNLKNYNQAIDHFKLAAKDDKVNKMAQKWLQFVTSEKLNQERLKQSVAAIGY
ncbi:tetratricopeptide repeat protein [Aliikangiella maris]